MQAWKRYAGRIRCGRGDRLHIVSEVLGARPSRSKSEQGIVKIRVTTSNQNNELVQIMISNLVVQRQPG